MRDVESRWTRSYSASLARLVIAPAPWDAVRTMPKVVVIAGPNGAGKSTTAPAILRDALLGDDGQFDSTSAASDCEVFNWPDNQGLQCGPMEHVPGAV
jgi:hypothetical protein